MVTASFVIYVIATLILLRDDYNYKVTAFLLVISLIAILVSLMCLVDSIAVGLLLVLPLAFIIWLTGEITGFVLYHQ